jgi:hypothetical protein
MSRFLSAFSAVPGIVVLTFVAIGCNKEEPEASAASEAPKAATAAAAVACGKKGQPDCPLQGWMKKNLKAAMKEENMGKVAEGLDQVASHVPDGYDDWKGIAEDGAKAARDNDVAAVKRACKTCHDQHQKQYRKERRTEPLI